MMWKNYKQKGGGKTLTSDRIKQSNAYSLIKDMRKGFLVLKIDKEKPNDPSQYTIVDTNRSFKHVLGKDNETILGKKISQIIRLNHVDLDMLANVVKNESSKQTEYYIKEIDEWLLISVYYSQYKHLNVIFKI